MTKKLLVASGLLVAATLGFRTGQANFGDDEPVAKKPAAKNAQGAKRQSDEAAIRKQSAAFVQAFEKGDAKALAALWTEEGEYIDDEATTYRGRAAIAAAYAQFFAKNPKVKLELNIDSIRFLSRDTAVEEGYAKAHAGKADTSSRYSVLHVREKGKWLMALVREWPNEGADLRDLDWLIGTWVADTGSTQVKTTYAWDEGKKFIRVRFSIKDKERTLGGSQMIGKDPRTGKLRSWVFEGSGGIGEATWSQDGKRWIIEATGVQADGSEMTATNIMTVLDRDSFTWQSTDRTVDGESIGNLPPVKVRRVK